MKINKTLFISIVLAAAALLVSGTYWYANNQFKNTGSGSKAPSDTEKTQKTTTEELPVISDDAKEYTVKVFFSKVPESDDDPTKLFPLERKTDSQALAVFALNQLIKAPTDKEAAKGYYTELLLEGESNCEDNDFNLTVTGKTATVKFCRTAVGTGTMADARTKAQIEATLKQFKEIEKVVILTKDDDCLFDQSGLNTCKE